MHVFYLHGFASSPQSTKAAMVAERLRPRGLTVHCPDFNQPDFSTLTVSRMIAQTLQAIAALPHAPLVLIGSSLGAFIAVHVAARQNSEPGVSRVERMVLLAPALDFGATRMRQLGPDGLARWKATDRLDVYHYAYGRMLPVRYGLYEDAEQYDAIAVAVDVPMLIFQGTRDDAVDPAMVERYAREHQNVTLQLFDDDHQLLASMPEILDRIESFLGLASR
jgi:hypothetical protein